MKNLLKQCVVAIGLAGFFCIAAPVASYADAQAAMDRGLAAAKQKKWDLAIKHFSEAQKEAPANPEALFNLALAYDSAKGRELLALCWFYAYLEAAPDAPNAEQVRKRVGELEVLVESNMHKLAVLSKNTVTKLPAKAFTNKFDSASETGASYKNLETSDVSMAQAFAGDLDDAYQTAGSLEGVYKILSYSQIAYARASVGDTCEAEHALISVRLDDLSGSEKTDRASFIQQIREIIGKENKDAGLDDQKAVQFSGLGLMRFNCQRAPFNDKRVREAFELVRRNAEGEAGVSRARKLLAEAGFPGGAGFPAAVYFYVDGRQQEAAARELQAALSRDLGVTIELSKKAMPASAMEDWSVIARSLIDDAEGHAQQTATGDAQNMDFFWGSFGKVAPVDFSRFLDYVRGRKPRQVMREVKSASIHMAAALYKIRKNARLKGL